MTILDVSQLYAATGTAKLSDLPRYEERAKQLVPSGDEVILTGPAPIWLYLRFAHSLHGWAKRILYDCPVSGPVEIFNQNPF